MKGIILHGGHGTRLRPLTHTGPKQLLTIANKPMSQYALEDLRKIGIRDIAIIVGDVYPEKVKEFYGDGSKFGVKITYIFQDKPKGIAHAIRLCKEFVGKDRFVVYLGDNILRKGLENYAKRFESSNVDAMILLCEVDDPSRFGIVELDGKKIKKLVEKPKNPTSNLAIIGVYFLTPKIFDVIDKLKLSWRGELEITEALQLLMEQNYSIEYDIVTGWWKDTGTPDDILHANRLVLDTIGTPNQFVLNEGVHVEGNIVMGKNTIISRDSFVSGPAIIGDNCTIGPAARIGPYVSIGNNSTLKYCDIENSILMDDCIIDKKIHISDSIIAHGSEITNNHKSKKHQFLLGERSQVKL
ncbi:MAG: glucose-1-phosphate thymidylyltransferase [Nitrosopumilaceae archaeon]